MQNVRDILLFLVIFFIGTIPTMAQEEYQPDLEEYQGILEEEYQAKLEEYQTNQEEYQANLGEYQAILEEEYQANLEEYQTDLGYILQNLPKFEKYIKYVEINKARYQIFEVERALNDGIDRELTLLAKEMVDYQNDMVRTAANTTIKDITQMKEVSGFYPRLQNFYKLLSDSDDPHLLVTGTKASLNACGGYNNPVPNFNPRRYTHISSSPHQTLLELGYHNTSSYACGGGCSEYDYTKGRGYNSRYGYCRGPRFRNHAIAGSTRFSVQYGEPNPEISYYLWPYWGWGNYVRWWHNKFN